MLTQIARIPPEDTFTRKACLVTILRYTLTPARRISRQREPISWLEYDDYLEGVEWIIGHHADDCDAVKIMLVNVVLEGL